MGHGHVTPNANGLKARCGGPAICPVCQREQAVHTGKVRLRRPLHLCPGPNCNLPLDQWVKDRFYTPPEKPDKPFYRDDAYMDSFVS